MSDSNDIASALIAKLDTSVPHSARVWNYWLGGKDNFEADRRSATTSRSCTPTLRSWLVPRGRS